jgi:hypothetical protein
MRLSQHHHREHDKGVARSDEEAWVEELYPPEPGSFFAAGWREWLHELFLLRGPVELDEVENLARSVTEERARRACGLVATDALATLGETIEISTVRDEWGVRVIVDSHVVSGVPLHSIGEVELVVEVADGAQEEIMGDWRVWPECPHHDAGLHAELHDGQALWRCRVGDHEVGSIGHLGEATKLSKGAAKRRARKARRR